MSPQPNGMTSQAHSISVQMTADGDLMLPNGTRITEEGHGDTIFPNGIQVTKDGRTIHPVGLEITQAGLVELPGKTRFAALVPRAAQEVFNTPELLECILALLPFSNLTCARRISRQVRDTIQNSPTLQPRLFRSAAPLYRPKQLLIFMDHVPGVLTSLVKAHGEAKLSISCTTHQWTQAKDHDSWQYSELRKMLVSQPPTHYTHVYRDCDKDCGGLEAPAFVTKHAEPLVWDVIFRMLDTVFRDPCPYCGEMLRCRIYVMEQADLGTWPIEFGETWED